MPFVEKSIFSSLNCFCSFVKHLFIINVWVYIWALCFIPVIFSPFLHEYYAILITVALCSVLKSRNISCQSSDFVPFSSVLAILGLLFFSINFRISLLIVTKKPDGIFIGIELNLLIKLGRTDILVILTFPIHGHEYPYI